MEWSRGDFSRRSMEPPLRFDPWLYVQQHFFQYFAKKIVTNNIPSLRSSGSLWRSIPLLSMLLPENNASTGLWCLVTKQYISNNTQRHNCQKKFWIVITPFSQKLMPKGGKKGCCNAGNGKIEWKSRSRLIKSWWVLLFY